MHTRVEPENRVSPRAAGYPQQDGVDGSKLESDIGFLHGEYIGKVRVCSRSVTSPPRPQLCVV